MNGPCPREHVLCEDEGHRYCNMRPPKGQDTPDHYFEDVLEGARLIEGQCSKNIMFE